MKKHWIYWVLRFRDLGIYAVLLALIVTFGLTTRNYAFVSGSNLVDILQQSSILCVAAVGLTLVIVTGGIDLSLGSIMAIVGLLSALAGTGGWPCYLIFPAALAIGLTVGSVNAFSITKVDVPPLITTLAMMAIIRGAVQWITQGQAVYNRAPDIHWEILTWMGRGALLGIPAPVVVAAVVFCIGWVLLNKTIWGTYLYGLGCNEEACRLSGVSVPRMKFFAYGLAGAIFAVAGLVNMGRQGYALPAAATGFELDVITAVVLGGVSIMGGEGKLLGVLAGVLILGVLDNGLTMLNFQFYQITVIKGSVLLLAVGFDRFCRRALAAQEASH